MVTDISGKRTHVTLQTQVVLRDKRNAIEWEKLSVKRRRHFMRYKCFTRFQPRYKVAVAQIDTKDKIAEFIRNNYGFGEFNILFFDSHHLSKKYKPNYLCKICTTTDFSQKGKIRKRGASCKHNKRVTRAFVPRGKIIIKDNKGLFDYKDYEYIWLKTKDGKDVDKMKMLWFWKGDDKEEILPPDNKIRSTEKLDIVEEMWSLNKN